MTSWATLARWPNQIGGAMTRMSAALIWARICGHSSPSPSSDETPVGMWWSTIGIVSLSTSMVSNQAITFRASASVLDTSGERLRVQFRNRALSVMDSSLSDSANGRRVRVSPNGAGASWGPMYSGDDDSLAETLDEATSVRIARIDLVVRPGSPEAGDTFVHGGRADVHTAR